jgi:hypothetical protein
VLLSYKFDFEVRSDTARGRLLVSDSFKIWLVHFLRIATSVTISRERKRPPQSASPDVTHDIIWLAQMLFTKKVCEVGALPNDTEANIETPAPEDGNISDGDGSR